MQQSVSDILWTMALGAEVGGAVTLIIWILVHTWAARKDKRRKAKQTALRESKEAEAREACKDDKILGEVQAFYDGI
jgi:FtsZ-interacting cell division protein ZipA